MRFSMGSRELELGGPYLGDFRDSSAVRNDFPALRERLAEDGYLFIRGLHDPQKVKAARRALLTSLENSGQLDRTRPLDQGYVAAGASGAFQGGPETATRRPEFLAVVEAPELLQFFNGLFGAPAMTYSYKELRAEDAAATIGAHYDIVYMGRGTTNVCTLWTPLGDVPRELGSAAVLSGSHRIERLKETYGRLDVDRDQVANGWFSEDPIEMVDRFGGRWLTADFKTGDALIFSMYTMHASLNNGSDRFRLSCDVRFQRADEPADERWTGDAALGQFAGEKSPAVPMEEARKRWGL